MRNYTIEELSKKTKRKRKEIYLKQVDFLKTLGYEDARRKVSKRALAMENYITLIHYCENKGGCSECKENDFRFLEFNHIDPSLKSNTISRLVFYSRKSMLKELEKCEILCIKCHRKRTQEDLYHYRLFNREFCVRHNIKNIKK